MALKYLADTNIISELERSQPNQRVLAQFQMYKHEIGIAAVSWHELVYGYHRLPKSRRKERVGDFLFNIIGPTLPIVPFDAAAAEWFGRERARLAQIGQPPSFADGQIAATAAVSDLVLITRNEQDFRPFTGLTIENWF